MKYSFIILALTARAIAEADKGEEVQVKTVGVQPGTTIHHTGALTEVHTVPAGGDGSPQSPKVITSPLSKQVFTSIRESEKTIHPTKQGGDNSPAAQQDPTTSLEQGSTMSTKATMSQESSSSKNEEQQSKSKQEQKSSESEQHQSESQKSTSGGEESQPKTTTTQGQGIQETPEPGSSPEGEPSSKTTTRASTTGGGASPQQETEGPTPTGGGDDEFDPYGGLHNGTDPLSSFDTGPEPTGPAVAAPIFPVVGDEDADEVEVPQTLRAAAKSNANNNNRVKNDTPFKNPLDGHLPVLNAGKSAPESVPDSILVKFRKGNDTATESQSSNGDADAEAQTSASGSSPNNNFQASKTAATEPTPSTLIDTTSMSLMVNDQKKHTSTSSVAASSVSSAAVSSAASTPEVSQQSAASSQ